MDEKDLGSWIKWAESQGWEVRTDASGYRRFYDPEGNYVANYKGDAGQGMATNEGAAAGAQAGRAADSAASRREQREQRRRDGS